MSDSQAICANRQCNVGQDGKCVEGYEDLTACPFYGSEPEEEDEGLEDGEEAVDTFDGVYLPDALAMDGGRTDRVLGILPSRMIGIIGVHDSGKTSVIAGVYDLFQMGTVAEAAFAGSSTLHGFEMICHDARAASERDEPHSERTKRGQVRYYHLDVFHEGALRSLLVADRSGEEYEEVADLAANAAGMFELRRADVITVLVDGRRLATPAERADTMGAIPLIIQGMVENGAFSRRPNLAVVLTKNDAVQASPRRERVERDFQTIVDGLKDAFSDQFGECRAFATSASPGNAGVERGAGLAEMFDFWLRPGPVRKGFRARFWNGRVFDGLQVEETRVG